MTRWLALLYGLVCYALTGVVMLYFAAFLNDVWLPRSLNRGPEWSIPGAVAADLALLALFGLQHSGMARPAFKRVWTRFVPPPVERSTYLLFGDIALVLLLVLWRPLPGVVWDVAGTFAEWPIWLAAGLGVLILIAASFQLDHWDLLGLRPVWEYARGRPTADGPFQTPGLYRFVRHPLMLGLLLALWVTPTLTVGRLLFNAGLTAYMLLALRWEERDLMQRFGPVYAEYRRHVPLLLPWKGQAL
jgi:protein-S-isoprenylcysteine O-methyltransferase Ste14